MLTLEQHIDNLVRHIDLVRQACLLLGKKLIAAGRQEFGRIIISKGYSHDASKFCGIEWSYLHAGKDVPVEALCMAIKHHVETNPHHPEYWGGHIEQMPEICIAEMTCDIYARSQEKGTCLRDWIEEVMIDKYSIDITSQQYKWLIQFVDMLLEDNFVSIEEDTLVEVSG